MPRNLNIGAAGEVKPSKESLTGYDLPGCALAKRYIFLIGRNRPSSKEGQIRDLKFRSAFANVLRSPLV